MILRYEDLEIVNLLDKYETLPTLAWPVLEQNYFSRMFYSDLTFVWRMSGTLLRRAAA